MVLGFVQGLTEFLPVSSSGHLVLGGYLLSLEEPHLLFDVTVHAATLLATLLYYRRSVLGIGSELVTVRGQLFSPAVWRDGFRSWSQVRLLLMICVGSIPTGIIGIFFKDVLEGLFSAPRFAAVMLLVTAALLMTTAFRPAGGRRIGEMTYVDALLIGLVQGVAIIPGISRSGSTIACALLLGIDRELAARFSFLLSVPAILGAVLLKGLDAAAAPQLDVEPLLVGFVTAAVAGIFALIAFIPIVNRGRLHYFALYLVPVGLAGVFLLS